MEEITRIVTKMEDKKKEMRGLSVRKIGIFGSFSRGEQKKVSDVDIIVTFDNYINLKMLLKKRVDLLIEEDLRPELNYVKKRRNMLNFKIYLKDIKDEESINEK